MMDQESSQTGSTSESENSHKGWTLSYFAWAIFVGPLGVMLIMLTFDMIRGIFKGTHSVWELMLVPFLLYNPLTAIAYILGVIPVVLNTVLFAVVRSITSNSLVCLCISPFLGAISAFLGFGVFYWREPGLAIDGIIAGTIMAPICTALTERGRAWTTLPQPPDRAA